MTSPNPNTNTLPLIYTKLSRPRIADDLIPRSSLLQTLQAGINKKLTLISAPVGFGKTMLACMWLEACRCPTAWLSLDGDDANTDRFLCYLVAAIQTIFPQACAETDAILQYDPLPPVDDIAIALINDLARLPIDPATPRIILTLDDYHHIQNEAIHQVLSKVIAYQPQHLHLLLISRQDPMSLPLSRLRARREMTEIRAMDLRFKTDETKSFLRQTLDTRLPDGSISLLEQQLEGWAAGLQLLMLSMRGLDDPSALVANLQGNNRFITEYLIDEVLARQPTAVQEFMLQISILNRFCGSLCEAVTGGNASANNGQTSLEWLEQTNLFLIALDSQQTWYRFHHLFQELLSSKLAANYGTSEITALHHQASQWYADHEYIEEAIYHAQAAQDVDLAVHLVETRCQQFLNRGRTNLERWLALLPQAVLQKRPKLLMAQAWCLYFHWRISRLKVVLAQIDVVLQDDESGLSPAEHQAMRAQCLTLGCVTTYVLDENFSKTVASARRALHHLPSSESGAKNIALSFLGLAQQALGDPERELPLIKDDLQRATLEGPATFQSFIGLCMIQLVAGENYQLQQTITRYLGHAPSDSLRGAGTSWIAGLLDYEWNRLAEAKTHFANIYAVEQRRVTNFIAAFNGTLGYIRLLQLEGKWHQAQEALDILHRDTARLQNIDFMPLLEAFQAYQWHLQGETVSAMRWVYAARKSKLPDSIFFFTAPLFLLTRILISHGTDAEAQAITVQLQEALNHVQARHWVQREIQVLAHLALIHNRLGQTEEAGLCLRQALGLAFPAGALRSFVDCGPALIPLLQQCQQRNIAPAYIAQLLAAFPSAPQPHATSNTTPKATPPAIPTAIPAAIPTTISHTTEESAFDSLALDILTLDSLTQREEEILTLMAAGLTNQELADKLVISLHTVKRHATNIYNKLAVSNRRQAIRKARQKTG